MCNATRPSTIAFLIGAHLILLTAGTAAHVLTYAIPAGGKHVEIRGSFDGWQKGHELKANAQDATIAEIDIKSLGLQAGRYEYKFLVDGKFEDGANRVLLIDSQGLPAEPSSPSAIESHDWRKPMEEARGRKDWPAMIEICRRATDEGITDEYLLRSLSWAHRNLKQTAESWEVAQRNLQINPCTWSRIEYIDSARDHGMHEEAVKVAIELKNDGENWGELAREAERAIASVSSHTYEIRWRIHPGRAANEKRAIAIPQQDPWVQKSVEVNVEGLRRWSFRTSDDGIRYVEAMLSPRDKDVWVTAKVTLSPHSWKAHLHKVTDEPFPPELRWYLRKGEYEGNPEAIDPTGPLAKQLAAELEGASHVETVENILKYITENIPWEISPEISPENAGPSSEACLQVKKGTCTPRTFAATAILRAAG